MIDVDRLRKLAQLLRERGKAAWDDGSPGAMLMPAAALDLENLIAAYEQARDDAIEECAKVCDAEVAHGDCCYECRVAITCAAAIRAMKEKA